MTFNFFCFSVGIFLSFYVLITNLDKIEMLYAPAGMIATFERDDCPKRWDKLKREPSTLSGNPRLTCVKRSPLPNL